MWSGLTVVLGYEPLAAKAAPIAPAPATPVSKILSVLAPAGASPGSPGPGSACGQAIPPRVANGAGPPSSASAARPSGRAVRSTEGTPTGGVTSAGPAVAA
jgi:hypothetical protein